MKTILVDLGLLTDSKRGMGVYIFNLIKNIPQTNLNLVLIFVLSKNYSKQDVLELKKIFLNNNFVKFYFSPLHPILTEQILIPCLMFFNKSYSLLSSGDSAPFLVDKEKIILLLHDLYFFKGMDLYKNNRISFKKKLGQFYRRVCIKRFFGFKELSVITVSSFMKNEISIFFNLSLSNIEVIPNGINLDRFENFEFSTDKKGLTLISGLDPQKNLNNFLDSLYQLEESVLNKISVVNIIGVTNDNFFIKVNDSQLNINFLGYLPHLNVLDVLKRSEFFVLPSLYESFGIPGLEALLSGCKVCASETGALKEVMGDCSLYFNPLDTSSIANKISFMVNSPSHSYLKVFNQIKEYDWKISSFKLIKYLSR
jgi:glycosyltransferase involved in cell wall biosynthesis